MIIHKVVRPNPTIKDEGTEVVQDVDAMDFVGFDVSATSVGTNGESEVEIKVIENYSINRASKMTPDAVIRENHEMLLTESFVLDAPLTLQGIIKFI